MKTIKEKNRMIAEFMGYETYEHTGSIAIRITEVNEFNSVDFGHVHTKYHTSWDWLMPVVEKIESIGYSVKIQRIKTSIHRILEDAELFGFVCGDVSKKREITYDTIVKFIEWYNENK